MKSNQTRYGTRLEMARCGIALAVLVGLGLLLVGLWLRVSAQAQEDEAQRADVIIILGCAVWPGERPSPSLEARVQHGIVPTNKGWQTILSCRGV